MRFKKNTAKSGSLLIEALLAVVILSVGLTLILQSMITSLRASVYGSQYSQAIMLAENILFDAMRVDKTEEKNASGQFLSPFERYRYQITTEDISDFEELPEESPAKFKQLDVDISWPAGRHEKKLSVSTYLLNTSAEE